MLGDFSIGCGSYCIKVIGELLVKFIKFMILNFLNFKFELVCVG